MEFSKIPFPFSFLAKFTAKRWCFSNPIENFWECFKVGKKPENVQKNYSYKAKIFHFCHQKSKISNGESVNQMRHISSK